MPDSSFFRDDGSYSYENYNEDGDHVSSYDRDADGNAEYENHEQG